MKKTRLFSLVAVFAIIILYSSGGLSQNSQVISLSTGGIKYDFIPQSQLGYVVKSANDKSAMTLLQSSLQSEQNNERDFLEIENKQELMVILANNPLVQNQNMKMLSGQAGVEYSSPLYSLDGQTVAVIPEIVVRLINKSDYNRLEDLCLKLDCTIVKKLLYTKLEFQISSKARTGEEVLKIAQEFDAEDFIEWAFPNLAFQPRLNNQLDTAEPNRVEPNDVYFNNQWHLDQIRAPEAWAYTTGDPNIIIAVIDGGVEINHPDLVDNIWTNQNEIPGNGIDDDGNGQIDDIHGWDFFNDQNDVNPLYDDAHGTACAGLVAAKGNNNLGVVGVAWNCTVMPIRISQGDNFVSDTAIATAFRYAAISGADILSNSWGGTADVPIIYSAIRDITQPDGIGREGKGCLVFVASGNWLNGGPVTYPAKYQETVAIGAIDQRDIVWKYSGSGPELDFVVPSGDAGLNGNIWTTDITGAYGYNNRDWKILDYTDKMGGTSGACPIAAGVAALVLSAEPNLSNNDIVCIMSNCARDLGPSGWDEKYGYGCLDARELMSRVMYPRELNIFVDDNAPDDPGPGNPLISDPMEDGSPEHPFDSIKKAIDYAVYKDTVIVLPGEYTGNGNYNIDFSKKVITVRSQDGAGSCIIDCQNNGQGFLFQQKEGNHSIIDGFTIINGKADKGGGINILYSNPTILNCILTGNTARWGGGIYNSSSNPTIKSCSLIGNSADYDGAGIYNNNTSLIMSDCNLVGNIASNRGGGLYSSQSAVLLENSSFTENSAIHGGGIYNSLSESYFINCAFTKNSVEYYGGGIYNNNGDPVIYECTFTQNYSQRDGAGIYNAKGDSILIYCDFTGNSAQLNGGGINTQNGLTYLAECVFTQNSAKVFGGGLYCNNNGLLGIEFCTFIENSANDSGGGMYNLTSTIINSCSFTKNSSDKMGGGVFNCSDSLLINCNYERNNSNYGGGLYNYSGHSAIYYSSFTENSADSHGGGMYNNGSKSNTLNCIFFRNTANLGGGEFGNAGNPIITNCTFFENTGGIYQEGYNCKIYNSIIWNNDLNLQGYIYTYYSNIRGGWTFNTPIGALDTDPLFADPENGDFHLKSEAGRWDPVNKVWVQDDVTSPCVDSGNRTDSVAGEVWPHGNRVNMGAYGGTPDASLSLSNVGDIRDLDSNGGITLDDVLILTEVWDANYAPLKQDLDRSGNVDVNDLAYFNGNWSEDSNNIVPVIDLIGEQYVTVGSELSFAVTAFDEDDDALTFIAAGLPEDAEFEEQIFSWTPQESGTYFVTFIVTDLQSLNYITLKITVEEQ